MKPPMKSIKSKDKPHLSVSAKDVPAVKDWKIDGKYYLILEVKQTSIRKEEWGPNKGSITAGFEVQKISEYKDKKK